MLIDEGFGAQLTQHNEMVRKNREILRRLIDITSLLGRQELSFRRHDESTDFDNYREYAEMLSRYNEELESLLFFGNV